MDVTSRKQWRFLAIAIGMTGAIASGCQSYPNLQLPNGTRVPPPATGSYTPPGQYYNNPAASPVSQSSNNSPTTNATTGRGMPNSMVMPASAAMPTNTTPNSPMRGINRFAATDQSAVSQAVYNDSGSNEAPVISAGAIEPMGSAEDMPAQRSLGDTSNTAVQGVNLQWQQP